MANIIKRVRETLATFISPTSTDINAFFKAFYSFIGGNHTSYDKDAKTYIDKGFGCNPDVFAVTQQQATKTASIPVSIKKVKDKQAKAEIESLYMATKGVNTPQQELKRRILNTKAFEEKQLPFPMERPNEIQTWVEIFSLYKVFLAITGNVYFYLLSPSEGQNKGTPLQVYILPSHLMNIVLKHNANMLSTESPIDYYNLIEGEQSVRFEAEDIIHVKLPNPNFDMNGAHLYGLSRLKAGLRNIETSNSAIDLNSKTMQNGGAFGFIHSKGQTPMTSEQALAIKDRMLEMDASKARLSKIAATNAEVGFTRLSLTTDELRPFDFLKFDQKTICNILGWSDVLLNNDDGGKYDKVKQVRQEVITGNIIPDLKLLEQAFNDKFLPRFKGYEGTVIEWDASELPEMQQDMKELVAWLSVALGDAAIDREEYRIALNYPESSDPNMKVRTVSGMVTPLDDALTPMEDFNNAPLALDE